MRVIKVLNNTITETKQVLDGYILQSNEIQSDTGELSQIMQPDGTFIDSVPPLEQAKNSKIAQVNDLYNQHLEAGFTSSATGTPYVFGYGQTDREKFMQLAISVLSNVATFPVPIPAKDGSNIMHDQTQYNQILIDINTFAWGAQNRLHELTAQVEACTTVDEVNAIVVSF